MVHKTCQTRGGPPTSFKGLQLNWLLTQHSTYYLLREAGRLWIAQDGDNEVEHTCIDQRVLARGAVPNGDGAD